MISKWKIITAAIVLILIVAVIVLAYLFMNERDRRLDVETELKVKTTEVTLLYDKAGMMYARVEEYHKSVRELKRSNDSVELKMYEEIRLNSIRNRQVEKLQYAMMESIDTIKSHIIDTIVVYQGVEYDKTARFDNGYLDAVVYLQKDSTNAILDYSYEVELYMTDSWTKPKFFLWRWLGFKGRSQQFDFKCSDPNAKVSVLRSISTKRHR